MIVIYTDGSFNMWAKRGGWAYVILYGSQRLPERSGAIEDCKDNNVAELTAARMALMEVPLNGEPRVELRTDCEVVINQLQAEFPRVAFRITPNYKGENRVCDRLAYKEAFSGHERPIKIDREKKIRKPKYNYPTPPGCPGQPYPLTKKRQLKYLQERKALAPGGLWSND